MKEFNKDTKIDINKLFDITEKVTKGQTISCPLCQEGTLILKKNNEGKVHIGCSNCDMNLELETN